MTVNILKINFILSSLILFLAFPSSAFATDEWRLDKSEGGIKVFTRAYPESEIREIKAVMEVESSLAALLAIIEDHPNASQLNEIVAEAHAVGRVDERHYKVYMRMAMPWPVQDRDVLNCREINQNNESYVVTVLDRSCGGGVAPKRNVVRMTASRQQWRFSPLDQHSVKVEFTAHSDPEGPIPVWLINSMSTDAPYQILNNLRALIQVEPYVSSKFNFIVEPAQP